MKTRTTEIIRSQHKTININQLLVIEIVSISSLGKSENRSYWRVINALKWFSAKDFMVDSGSVPGGVFFFFFRSEDGIYN